MGLGWTLIFVLIVVIVIWVAVEFKRFKHKFFAILLILLVLFGYLSFVVVFKGKDIDFKSTQGVEQAAKLYFSWLGSIFSNFKTITANAVKMDWGAEDNITTNSTKTSNPKNPSK